MFRDREEMRRRLQAIVEIFRQKGATTPEKAMTAQELGLPPRFEDAMHRRLGQTGIFVEVNGKCYLNEECLRQIQEQRVKGRSENGGGGSWNRGDQSSWFRAAGILLVLPIGLIVALALFYLLAVGGVSFFPGEFLILMVIVLVVVAVARILFWRARRNYWRCSNVNEVRSNALGRKVL